MCSAIEFLQLFQSKECSSAVELTGSEGHANILKTLFCSLVQHNESVQIGDPCSIKENAVKYLQNKGIIDPNIDPFRAILTDIVRYNPLQ